MARLKIKSKLNSKEKKKQLLLLEILAPAGVYANALHETKDGLIITTSTDNEADKILEPHIRKKLEEKGFTPILPQEVKSRRTVICQKVEDIAFDNSTNDIADEIETPRMGKNSRCLYVPQQ